MTNLSDIKGIGKKKIELLNKLDIYNISDLITHYPYRYEVLKRSNILELNNDDKIIIDGIIETYPSIYRYKNISKIQFNIYTKYSILKVIVFNRIFICSNIKIGDKVVVVGKYDKKNHSIVASDIYFNMDLNTIKIMPLYRTTNNLNKKTLKSLIAKSLDYYIDDNNIPDDLMNKYNFISKTDAIKEVHNPTDIGKLKKSLLMLKYEELFSYMLKIINLKMKNNIQNDSYNKHIDISSVNVLKDKLPFKLTSYQSDVLNEIINDLNSNRKMNRLLQGDVGSGKTIVSILAMYGVVNSGYECALMAPTEILARQHYNTIKKILPNIKVELLVGSITKKNKDIINNKLKNNEINIIVGTHALIQESVEFNNLGLVVIDEQHRFGVKERGLLEEKGKYLDILYMSATPIPRTYALTVYGDMDVSIIQGKPLNRKDITTYIKNMKDIKDVLYKIKDELDKHHQVYVIAPLIDGENNDSVTRLLRQYNLAFKNYNIGILHGKMKPSEKDDIMNNFINGNVDILISTTVIEVGVDVKNATMIVIHGASLFGLSTLHQLRGRVGRSEYDSYCILIGDNNNERLKILESTNDGFVISEEDFKLRGEGDLFGIKQSGYNIFKIADIKKDYKILLQAKKDANEYIKRCNNV